MGMTFKVGCDKVRSLGGGPCGPGDEAGVRLSAKGIERLALLRRGLCACLDRCGWYVLTADRVVLIIIGPLANA